MEVLVMHMSNISVRNNFKPKTGSIKDFRYLTAECNRLPLQNLSFTLFDYEKPH